MGLEFSKRHDCDPGAYEPWGSRTTLNEGEITATSSSIALDSSNSHPDPSKYLHIWDFQEYCLHSYVQD